MGEPNDMTDIKINVHRSASAAFWAGEAPPQVIEYLCSFCPAKDIVNLSVCNKNLRKHTGNKRVWKSRLQDDFKLNRVESIVGGIMKSPMAAYSEQAQEKHDKEKREERRRQHEARLAKFDGARELVSIISRLITGIMPCFIQIMAMTFCILTAEAVDNGKSYKETNATLPVYMLISYMLYAVLSGTYTYISDNPIPYSKDHFVDLPETDFTRFFFKIVMVTPKARVVGGIWFTLKVTWFILICMMMDNELPDDTKWSEVWIPFYLSLPLEAIGIVFLWFRGGRGGSVEREFIAGVSFMMTCVNISLILIPQVLDGKGTITAAEALSPVFVLNALSLLLAFATGEPPAVFVWVILIAPWLISEAMVASWDASRRSFDDPSISINDSLISLYMQQGFLTLVGFVFFRRN